MEAIRTFFDMGGHAGYIWPAYGVAVLVLGGLVVMSLRQLRAREREAEAIEAQNPRRARRAAAGPQSDDGQGGDEA